MTSVSALNYIHRLGLFGNHQNKNEENLLKVSEVKNMLIVQIFATTILVAARFAKRYI